MFTRILAVVAVMALSASAANAVCQVTHGSFADVLANGNASHNEADCASTAAVNAANGIQDAAIAAAQAAATAAQTAADEADDTADAAQATADAALPKAGGTMSGDIDMDGKNVTNAGSVTASTVTTTGAPNATAGASIAAINTNGDVAKTGATINGDGSLDMNGTIVHDVGGPVLSGDAANKGYVDAGFNQLSDRLDEAEEGIALAISMQGVQLPEGKNFALGASIGFYEGNQAASAAAALRLSPNYHLNGAVGVGFESNSIGGRVGVMGAW